MKTTLPLPSKKKTTAKPEPRTDLFSTTQGLPQIRRVRATGPLLRPMSVGGRNVSSLTLARGCAHRCAFCNARGASAYPGDHEVVLFHDLPGQLREELAGMDVLPQTVVVNPDTDPFMPLAAVQAETVRAIQTLAERGVTAWLTTRGFVRPAAREVLVAHRETVRLTVALTTTDRDMQRLLEPLAAPPQLRLRQIAVLQRRGVPVRVEVGPLTPGVTDTRASLSALLDGLADAGVTQVTASYLYLRPGIRDNMVRALGTLGLEDQVLEAFDGGPLVEVGPGGPVRLLPKSRRQRGYATLMALAATRGISVSVSAATNPDFLPSRPVNVGPLPRLGGLRKGLAG
jgi:DNA repair photolyase